MARGVGSGRCGAETAQVNVERSRPESMSSEVARVDVEQSRPGRCRAESPGSMSSKVARVDVERSRPETMSIGVNLG